ncbi:MAG: pyridinium-3,5-bisthiocarboxylic acid mononucleotide nickel chelatase [Leptospiraceae bacterium]
MKTLYLESVGGIAGDMFTAAFLNAGIVDLREMNNILEILNLPDVSIAVQETRRRGIPCSYLEVNVASDAWKQRFHFRADGRLRMYEMIEYIAGLTLESQTLRLAREVLLIHASMRMGKPYSGRGVAARVNEENSSVVSSEANSIGTAQPSGYKQPDSLQDAIDPNDPALQSLYEAEEVVDLLIDAVFAAHCLRRSEATSFYASPVRSGGGLHDGERHPVHPTAELFRGLPVQNLKANLSDALRELSTPTGLSILRATDPQFLPTWPEGRVRYMGVGGGKFDSDEFANLFRVVLLDKTTDPGLYSESRREPEGYVSIQYDVRCGLSPTSPEKMAGILDELEKQGASEVRLYQRKDAKGKPGLGLAFICNDDDLTALSDYLLTNTTAFGIRYEKIRMGGGSGKLPTADRKTESGNADPDGLLPPRSPGGSGASEENPYK